MRGTITYRPITEGQIKFIVSLSERAGQPLPDMTGWTTHDASMCIDELKSQAGPKPATDKQCEFALSLLHERQVTSLDPAAREVAHQHFVPGLDQPHPTASDVSKLISALLAAPKRPVSEQVADDMPEVPAGYYAVESKSEPGHLVFFRVWNSHGRRGASLMVSDREQRLPRKMARLFMEQVADDPQAAMARFGREIGKCGVCGRTLTNDESRAFGIGPICRSN